MAKRRSSALPPGPPWSPAGATLRWLLRPVAMMEGCRARYGDVFTVRFLHEGTTVMISHPGDVQRIFTADPAVVHAGEGRRLMAPIFGENSVVCLDEEPHQAQRRLLLQPFHGDRLSVYEDLVDEITRAELAECETGTPVKFAPVLRSIALEIIIRAVFGIDDPRRAAPLRAATLRLLDFTSSIMRMTPLMLLGPDRAPRIPLVRKLLDDVDTLIYEEIAARQADPDFAERPDVLSMLLTTEHEDGTPIAPVEVRDQLVTLLIGGHETTATALSWGIERLSHSPQALARLRSEVTAGEDAYLDAVVKETLRIGCVLPVTSRVLKAPFELREHTIPAGTMVTVCSFLTHHDPRIYPQPYGFRPERFLEGSIETYGWIPFGGGVRRCIGSSFAILEMKTVLKALCEELRLEPVGPFPEPTARRAITLAPRNGCEVICERAPAGRIPEAR
ncbi:MAG: cytochrome P450 [Solirubrobacterales bacterium]